MQGVAISPIKKALASADPLVRRGEPSINARLGWGGTSSKLGIGRSAPKSRAAVPERSRRGQRLPWLQRLGSTRCSVAGTSIASDRSSSIRFGLHRWVELADGPSGHCSYLSRRYSAAALRTAENPQQTSGPFEALGSIIGWRAMSIRFYRKPARSTSGRLVKPTQLSKLWPRYYSSKLRLYLADTTAWAGPQTLC
jgi:hypothetical protein